MLKAKPCKLEHCNLPAWSKGYCKHHQHHRTDYRPPSLKTKPKEKDKALERFFTMAVSACQGKCQNCGATFEPQKLNVAHILPKSKFDSVKTHPFNWIELCWICHTNYDNRGWIAASQMPVFALAKKRFELFMDSITDEEFHKIPEQFSL